MVAIEDNVSKKGEERSTYSYATPYEASLLNVNVTAGEKLDFTVTTENHGGLVFGDYHCQYEKVDLSELVKLGYRCTRTLMGAFRLASTMVVRASEVAGPFSCTGEYACLFEGTREGGQAWAGPV